MSSEPQSNGPPHLRIVASDAPAAHRDFQAERARLLGLLADPQRHAEARRALDELYLARRRATRRLRLVSATTGQSESAPQPPVAETSRRGAPRRAERRAPSGTAASKPRLLPDADAHAEVSAIVELREMIAASLEDGLLRHSRRRRILAAARRLGLTPFNAQLLIAQVQFGGRRQVTFQTQDGATADESRADAVEGGRLRARLAAISLLAGAFFLALIRWSGVS